MVAKRFFYVCAGLLCLALAYHFGAMSATAQVPSNNPVVATFNPTYNAVVTANGDVYESGTALDGPWTLRSNVFTGPTPATQPTWGQLKSRYRPGAAATPQDK